MAKVQVLCLPALPIIMLCYWFLFVYVFHIIAFDLYMVIVLGINEYTTCMTHCYINLIELSLHQYNRGWFQQAAQLFVFR